MIVDIPLPPSVNECFANVPGKGRVKTKKYKDWIREAGWMAALSHPIRVPAPFTFLIEVPRGTRGDVDNRIKPALDLMVSLGLIPNDRYCDDARARRVDDLARGWARIIMFEA